MVEPTRVKKDVQEVEDGATYEGEWNQDGQRDGFGIQIWVDGERYEGQWSNDMMNDTNGVMTWPDGGGKYVGSYVDNVQSGFGVFEDEESKYTGEWKDDMQHGKGEMVRASGKVYNGEFFEGQRHG